MTLIEVRLLGGFSIHRAGEEVPPGSFGGRLPRTLVRVLVTQGGFVPADVLIGALWPGRPPADPTANLRILVNRARKAFGDPALIVTGPGGYALRHERCVIDAEVFLAQVEAGRDALRAGRSAEALRSFRLALDSWRGEPLPEDLYQDWAQPYRASLIRAYLEALEGGAAAALALGDQPRALALAEGAVAREPLREHAHLLVVRALASSGDAAGALTAFERMRERLVEELGLEPSPEATELQRRILQGDLPLVHPRRPSQSSSRPVVEELPFVGRHQQLEAVLSTVWGPAPGMVLLAGAAGLGKSRLLHEVASRSTVPVLSARAFMPEREEAWAVGRTLLEQALALDVEAARAVPERAAQALANVLPELEEVRTLSSGLLDPESRRALAIQGAVRLLEAAASRGVLLVVDDLQWADPTSLAFLGHTLRRVHGVGVLFAYRPEEVTADAHVGQFLTEARSLLRTRTVDLHPFSTDEICQLLDDELAQVMATETNATPLAVAEVIRTLAEQGAIELGPHGRWHAKSTEASEIARRAARAGQRRAIQDRAIDHPFRRRQLLSLLALLRRETPTRVLATAACLDQNAVLADLDALGRSGLVRLGDEGWAPHHDVVADALAELLDRVERGRLHAMLARALQAEGADPSEVARQLEGAGDVQAAAQAFADAARRSLARFSSAEAEQLAMGGLRLAQQPSLRAELLEVRAEARARLGDIRGARDDLRAALAHRPVGAGRAHLLARTAMLVSGAEDYVHADQLIELALDEAGSEPQARAQALTVGAILDFNTNRLDRAEARASEALTLFEQVADAHGTAEVLDAKAMIAAFQGRIGEGAILLDRVARLFEDSGKLLRVVIPRAFRGLSLVFLGQPHQGLADIDHGLELARAFSDPEAEGYCLGVRSFALTRVGQVEEARQCAAEALGIGRRLGHRELVAGALLFLGLAHQHAASLDQAEACFRRCLEQASGMPLFSSFAASRLARILIAYGDLEEAQEHVARALSEGPPLALNDARLVAVELAVARGDPDSLKLAREALALAKAGGDRLTSESLSELVHKMNDREVVDKAAEPGRI